LIDAGGVFVKHYLIVEDEELSRSILHDYLSDFASCDTAENGSQGFEFFKKAIVDGKPYDLVCTDLVMPLMDGYDLIRNIREYENGHAVQSHVRTNIFVISMSNSSVDMSHAILECDSDDYIVKPFHRDQLKSQLEKYNLI
jgi:two-component system chemotaxis response regulator CheY